MDSSVGSTSKSRARSGSEEAGSAEATQPSPKRRRASIAPSRAASRASRKANDTSKSAESASGSKNLAQSSASQATDAAAAKASSSADAYTHPQEDGGERLMSMKEMLVYGMQSALMARQVGSVAGPSSDAVRSPLASASSNGSAVASGSSSNVAPANSDAAVEPQEPQKWTEDGELAFIRYVADYPALRKWVTEGKSRGIMAYFGAFGGAPGVPNNMKDVKRALNKKATRMRDQYNTFNAALTSAGKTTRIETWTNAADLQQLERAIQYHTTKWLHSWHSDIYLPLCSPNEEPPQVYLHERKYRDTGYRIVVRNARTGRFHTPYFSDEEDYESE